MKALNEIESSASTVSSKVFCTVAKIKSSILAESSIFIDTFLETISAIVTESPLTPSFNLMKALNEIESSMSTVSSTVLNLSTTGVMKSSKLAEPSLSTKIIDFAEIRSATVAESPLVPSFNLMKALNEIESSTSTVSSTVLNLSTVISSLIRAESLNVSIDVNAEI